MSERDLSTAAGEVLGIGLAYARRLPQLIDATRAVASLALPKKLRDKPVSFLERLGKGWANMQEAAKKAAEEDT